MTISRAFRLLMASAAFVIGLLSAGHVVRANGAEFFEAENDGKIVLYYFGNVKDSQGNVVDTLRIQVQAKNAGLTFNFRNDSPGHYRTTDIGKAIQGLGKTVDPAQIEVTVTKPGYKVTRAPKVPPKLGAVQLDMFVMDPIR